MNQNTYATDKSALSDYFNELSEKIGRENLLEFIDGNYSYDESAPFLSVIMRTQGFRPEALSEVLLCLCGQSDMDFEVLIMGHNLTDEGRNSVNEIISELPDFMDKKVRLVEVTGGNRTTPLNEGFAAAKGRYISILDDDDLVFEDWVEAFHCLEKDNGGKILHTYCVSQDWESRKNEYGETVLISTSPFRPIYCTNFDLVKQLSQNYCPTFSLAFPAVAFNKLAIHFDETLTTTEDWDFLMRTALVCGVVDNPTITGIYRMWKNAENSATLHSKKEWEKNSKYIQNKFKSSSILVPKKDTHNIITSTYGNNSSSALRVNEFLILLDDGSGFESHQNLKLEFVYKDDKWTAICDNIEGFDKIKSVRIDPIATGALTVVGSSLSLFDEEGKKVDVKINKLRTNGVFMDDCIVFLGNDPQIRFDLKEPCKIKSLGFDFNLYYDTPLNFLRFPIVRYCIKHWSLGIFRHLRNFLRKIKSILK